MIPSFPKLLVDFGRQFIWTPLTISLKKDQLKSRTISCDFRPTFYCDGENRNEDNSSSVGSVEVCLSRKTNQHSVLDLTVSDKSCVKTCVHYPNCDQNAIDLNYKSIQTNSEQLKKSSSVPNLTFSDLYDDRNPVNKSDVNESQKFVTLTKSDANKTFDDIESVRADPDLNRIDLSNSSACVSVYDSDQAIDEVKSSNTIFPINNVITSELCALTLTDERNCITESDHSRETVSDVSTMNRKHSRDRYEPNDQILDKQIDSMDASVMLKDYFDCDKCADNSGKASLSTDRKSVGSSRNSRRSNVNDKRLRNAVLDRLKRLARSQSHGRSDAILSSSGSSRAFVSRTKGLYRNVKRRFSSAHACVAEEPNISIDDCMTTCSKINTNSMDSVLHDSIDTSTVVLRHCSSFESIEDSGCGSSIQTSSLSTDSNRSSICTGDDMNGFSSQLFRGQFISHAKAITDCTPCPYYKDALAFKRGDIISIIAKEESGTWIGMNTAGKIGHFKFVNVEEIKANDKHKRLIQLSQSINGRETHTDYNRMDDRFEPSLDRLVSRLMESNGSLNLSDVMNIIGLSESDSLCLSKLSVNGYNDLKSFASIGNKDTLNEIGITGSDVENILLNTAQVIREYFRKLNVNSVKNKNSSHKYFLTKINEAVTQSAPTTPAIDYSNDFSELISRLESVSTTSLDNNYDEVEHYSYAESHLKSGVKQFTDSNERINSIDNSCDSIFNDFDQTIYENNEQIIATHEQSSGISDNLERIKSNNCRHNNTTKNRKSLRFEIRDKSLDRNLLRKLDLKQDYYYSNNVNTDLSRGITGSKSVMDLRTNNPNYVDSNEAIVLPIDTLRNKKRLKKFISSSRKFSSFTSHASLVSLANNTGSESTKIVSKTLLEAIAIKLKSENIDLTQEPYSDSAGFCGIPPALIHRYTDECQRDTYEIAEVLDSIRMKSLKQKQRRGIPNDYLGDSCMGPVIDSANYDSLHSWLVSIGLPMYESCLKMNGYESLYRVSKLRELDIVNKCGINDKRHVRILTNSIGALHLSFGEFDKT